MADRGRAARVAVVPSLAALTLQSGQFRAAVRSDRSFSPAASVTLKRTQHGLLGVQKNEFHKHAGANRTGRAGSALTIAFNKSLISTAQHPHRGPRYACPAKAA